MEGGRVIAVLVSTLDGSVIYERFYARLSELERADLRAAAAATAATLFVRPPNASAADRDGINGREAVGRHRSAVLVSRCEGSLLLHAAATGRDHDELTLARALRSLAGVLRGVGAGAGSGGGGGASVAAALCGASASVKALCPGGAILSGGSGSTSPLTDSSAVEGYGKLILAIDDLVYEGIIDVTSNYGAARSARLRGCEV